MVMSLNHLIELLMDESKSRYMRAIRLFEFQTAVYQPKAFKRHITTQGDVRAPTKILRTARIFAAIKILEKIEADLQKKSSGVISIKDLAADEDYRKIFDDVISTNGGWTRIRHSPSARTFDKGTHLKGDEKKGARAVANIVDYSYRFSKHMAGRRYGNRKEPGGVDAAKYVVRNAVRPFVSESSIKTYWRKYQISAIFLFLMFNQKFNLKPPRVSSTNFLEGLLRQADDFEELRRFFCAYQTVRDALSKLKYKQYPALDPKLECSPPELEAAEFSPAMNKEFEAWVRLIDRAA
jgi:hypothetical protein